MSSETSSRSERRRTMWLGCALLALTTILAAFLQRKAGAHGAAAVAGVYASGVMGMAWLTSRVTEFPRWAWFASAGVFVLTLAAVAARYPAPAQVKDWMSIAWMLPWLYLVMALSPAPATGWCSPRAAGGGPLLLGMSAVFSGILLAVSELNR